MYTFKYEIMYKLVSFAMKWELFGIATADYLYEKSLVSKRYTQQNETAATFWNESDGWRSWSKEENKYYFNDIPEQLLGEAFMALDEMEEKND